MTKRYIAGSLGAGEYRQYLGSTQVPPRVNTYGDGTPQAEFFRACIDGKFSGRIENASFPIKRGVVQEFTSSYDGSRYVARETDDPALVAQIDEARARVDEARAALSRALADEQEVLRVCVARMKPAKVDA